MKTYVVLALTSICSRAAAFSTVAPPAPKAAKSKLLDVLPKTSLIGSDSAQVKSVLEACEALKLETSESAELSLDGSWKLRFTSASPYGLLPLDNLPESIRKPFIDDSLLLSNSITQTIDTSTADNSRVVNSIDLSPWPKNKDSNGNPLQQVFSAVAAPLGLESLQQATVHLELDHALEVNGKQMELKLESIRRTLLSSTSKAEQQELPAFIPKETNYNLPFSPPVTFHIMYLDTTLRVDKGPLGEMIVWERAGTVVADIMVEEMGDECEVAYEEDGTPVILCDNVEEGAMPSD